MNAIIIQLHESGTKTNSSKETTSTKNVAKKRFLVIILESNYIRCERFHGRKTKKKRKKE